MALGGWKGTKIGQDQQSCAQRLLQDPRGTPPLRFPPRPCAEAALLRCCAAESPGTEGEVFAPRQVPEATRVRPRSPRPRHTPSEAQPRPKAPAPPAARTPDPAAAERTLLFPPSSAPPTPGTRGGVQYLLPRAPPGPSHRWRWSGWPGGRGRREREVRPRKVPSEMGGWGVCRSALGQITSISFLPSSPHRSHPHRDGV